jgi:hypothetical protein
MPRFIPKGLEVVDAEQWCPDDTVKVSRFLAWFLDREGIGELEAYENQVIFNVKGAVGFPQHLEDGDWLVFDIRQHVGKRFKVVDKYSFDSAYEEVS